MTEHPMQPTREQVRQWITCKGDVSYEDFWARIARDAYAAGADAELEACVEWLEQNQGRWEIPASLRAARRPKPPSLKQRALEAQQRMWNGGCTHVDWELIRRALEALPND